MRLADWNPTKFDAEIENVAMSRLVECGEIVAQRARARCKVGTVSRPMYRKGKYAGQLWTSRDNGRLKKSIRVVRGKTKSGKLSGKRNVRVYIGNYLAYYAPMVEHDRPFLRPAFYSSMPEMKSILGVR